MLHAIDRDRFDVIPIGITRDGAFVLEDDDPDKFALHPEHLPEVVDNGTRIIWPDSALSSELKVADATGIRSLGDVDVVFPILHGRFGEDGTVQGFLELLDLPYVEDSRAMTDMNVAMTGSGKFVEIQGTAEHRPFSRNELGVLLDLATKGNRELQAAQQAALDADLR